MKWTGNVHGECSLSTIMWSLVSNESTCLPKAFRSTTISSSPRGEKGAEGKIERDMRMSPAHVPKRGRCRAKEMSGTRMKVASSRRAIVVDSPPGMMSASQCDKSLADLTSRVVMARERRIVMCFSKPPCKANTPIRFTTLLSPIAPHH